MQISLGQTDTKILTDGTKILRLKDMTIVKGPDGSSTMSMGGMPNGMQMNMGSPSGMKMEMGGPNGMKMEMGSPNGMKMEMGSPMEMNTDSSKGVCYLWNSRLYKGPGPYQPNGPTHPYPTECGIQNCQVVQMSQCIGTPVEPKLSKLYFSIFFL